MKKNLIISTKNFSSTAEYIERVKTLDSTIEWDSIKNWSDLATAVGIDLSKVWNHGRKGLDRLAEKIEKGIDVSDYSVETPKVEAPKVETPTEEKTGKLPRKSIVQKVTVDAEKVAEKVETPKVEKKSVETPKAKVVVTEQPTENVDEVASLLAQALSKLKVQSETPKVDLSELSEKLEKLNDTALFAVEELSKRVEAIESNPGKSSTIHIKIGNLPKVEMQGAVHEKFADIVKHVAIRDHVMLVGPAGSGKTTTCEQVATALELDFYCKSVCSQTSKAELLGYQDANGNYVSTDFRTAYENGGMFVLDEIDAGNPNVIAVLNSALANGVCSFADGMVKKHSDFVLIACANTFGMGADRMYVGRNQLDAATLDRFSVIDFGYDENLEILISGNETFAKCIQEMRREMKAERVVISPRATIQGAKLLAAGFNHKYVFDVRISKGMPDALKTRCLSIYKKYFKY